MRQRPSRLLALILLVGPVACERKHPDDVKPTAGGIVSLSPAATDLLVAMGLTDRVVGVSPYEANDRLRQTLPKLGDYERIDWERVEAIKPGYLIVQGRKDRMPAGQRERCQLLGIRPIILQIDRLADVRSAITQLGRLIDVGPAATKAVAAFDARCDKLKAAEPATPVRTLLTFSDDAAAATHVVGRETFIDDALTLAGGTNVIDTAGYPTIDHEKLQSLRPDVVFVLLPGATDAAVERTKAAMHTALPAATVYVLNAPEVLMPGTCALTLAETMAARLKSPVVLAPSPVYARERAGVRAFASSNDLFAAADLLPDPPPAYRERGPVRR